ncbi:hypothetical protein QAD02_013303 [Eretmocerus hayati]|uniref:Uncharacterized protein n=1 Tax=Eretmocerus hayati TaxID=131215 RepID=A0ACC2P3W8_9HYME|nr:hypothetical protein QAD02_013303 [Eretmocerus hayati]
MSITGITKNSIDTAGSTEITLFNQPSKFQVVTHELPTDAKGILGVEFFKDQGAEISFNHNSPVTSSEPIRPVYFKNFSPSNVSNKFKTEPRVYYFKARTRTQIDIDLFPTELNTGYLQKITAPNEVFVGEAAVTNNSQKAHIFAVNASESDVEISIPPQKLLPYDLAEESEDFLESSDSEVEQSEREKPRLERIIELLRLDHLNGEEREHVKSHSGTLIPKGIKIVPKAPAPERSALVRPSATTRFNKKKVTFQSDRELGSEDELPPVPRGRGSGFRSLVSQKPPLRKPEETDIVSNESSDEQREVLPKNVKVTSPRESSSSLEGSDEYWWDEAHNQLRPKPIGRSTPLASDSDENNDTIIPQRDKLSPIEEETDESSTESDIEEVQPEMQNPSDSVPPDLFYPDFHKDPGSELCVKIINTSITHTQDNILHFSSADCEFTTPT